MAEVKAFLGYDNKKAPKFEGPVIETSAPPPPFPRKNDLGSPHIQASLERFPMAFLPGPVSALLLRETFHKKVLPGWLA
jgi:hypothetical protein